MNYLGAKHLEILVTALPGQTTLQRLNLAHNRLCDVWLDEWGIEHGIREYCGLEALAKVLGESNKYKQCILDTLDLRGSFIRDPKLTLADSMVRNASLTSLNGMHFDGEVTQIDVSTRSGGLDPYECSFIGTRLLKGGADELDILEIQKNGMCGQHLNGTGYYNPYGGLAPC